MVSRTSSRASPGDPAAGILEVAEREAAALVVIGSRGLGALSGPVRGSVSQKLVHPAPFPVPIVK